MLQAANVSWMVLQQEDNFDDNALAVSEPVRSRISVAVARRTEIIILAEFE